MASKKTSPRSATASTSAHDAPAALGTAGGAITFLVPGQRPASRSAASSAAVAATGMPGVLKDAVQVSKRRDALNVVRVVAVPDEDVVVLRIAGGPTLVLHPKNARDLLLGQGTTQRSQRAANPNADSDAVEVPAQLRWLGLEQAAPARSRGFLGDVLLSSFEVVTGLFKDKAVDFVASEVVKKVDSQVDAGVYALRAESLAALKGSGLKVNTIPAPAQPTTEPILVLIHGTFVDTFSTFGKLWALHPQRVQELFDFYGGRVYALDHPTLGASPMANALTLVQVLPAGAHLHLATHSRGGLVAEVLCRVAAQPQLSAQDLAFFAGDNYAAQRVELQALASAVRAKGITVQRVLRVACPARGTLLASKRLDAYLSVLQWSIELAGVPVLPQLVNFLSEVARRRASPQELPGLAAMIPDTPLVNWLNGAEEPIAGDLRVVAGDLQGDSIGSWIKTLLADAYYWTDNDVVVQTRSMYGGSPRLAGAQFLLDQGGKVTHFNYFVNDRTVQALVQGLTQDRPAGFATIGPLSWAGQVADGARAGPSSAKRERSDGKAPHELPAVFVLPGILGSHLKVGDKRIWLSLRLVGGLSKLQYTGSADGVESDGPVGLVYDKLMTHLADSHEVKAFGFDWRRPLEEEAQRLADAVDQALDARQTSGQPVRLLAHSMGGLLARTMQLERPQTFARLMQHAGARFLMLGTPNGGSWAPMQVLSGDDTFGNVLTAFGSPLRDQQARQWMAQMPGFLQLQAALTQPELQLSNSATWRKLAQDDLTRVQEANWWHRYAGESADAAYEWGLPTQAVLDRALALRQRLDMQRENALPAFAAKTLLVVGHAAFTPDGYEVDTGEGFVYLNTPDGGDGRVTLTSALLPGVKTWTLDCDHGSLPDLPGAFGAYSELLETGDTTLLKKLDQRPAQRSAGLATAADEVTATEAAQTASAAKVRSRPSRARPSTRPAQAQNAVFSTSTDAGFSEDSAAASGAALRVEVLNGNLSFVRQPLLVGHTRSLVLTGTEKAINGLMGGALQASLDTGLYADAAGSHQVFINARQDATNPWLAPQPVGVVVVGLGEEGKLNEQALALSVRQAVLAWVQRVAEGSAGALSLTAGGSPPTTIELAATLMGSGGMGMNAGTSARAIAQGVRDANDRLARTNPLQATTDDSAGTDDATNGATNPSPDGANAPRRAKPARDTGWPLVSQLTLVELYLERASDAWNGLQVLAASAPGRFVIAPTIQTGKGPLRRQIDSGYRGADYDFIAATTASTEAHLDIIEFKLDTKRARTEVKAQSTQGRLLRQMVAQASTASNNDPRLGRTLFQLLVPLEVEPFLSGTSRMVLELDAGTAPIPWELLDTQRGDGSRSNEPPWAIRTQLLRKLRTDTYREQVQDANRDDAILVVGEPAVDPKQYDSLPGARNEALAVVQALQRHGRVSSQRVKALVADNSATEIVNALFEHRYRIVHIAGHGEPVQREEQPPHKLLSKGGVVLSDGAFLGADEINSMRVVPELVFVNCCHLAAREGSQVLKPREPFNRAEFAWGVADSLINIGVRCVIAAGWAVDDGPAKEFADVFYREIMNRRPFAHAVACAREAAWNFDRESNTWAAYQCYGDPNWTYRHSESDPAAVSLAPSEEFSGVASPLGVALALEEVAVRAKWMHADSREQHKKVRHLEARFGSLWGDMGAVAEAFGVAYADTGDTAQALHWYDKALRSNDASASLKAHEQVGNLRARQAWEHLKKAQRSRTGVTAQDLSHAREQITAALRSLQALAGLQPTLERYSLCGSAWKRLALVDRLAQQLQSESQTASSSESAMDSVSSAAADTASLQMAHTAYRQAEMLATEQGHPQLYYPALNRITLDLMLSRSQRDWPAMNPKETAAVRLSLQEQALRDPDFWVFASLVEVDQWEALAEGSLAQHLDGLLRRYADLHAKVAARGMWASLADQAELVLAPMTDQSSAAGAATSAKNRAAAVALRKALRGYAGQAG